MADLSDNSRTAADSFEAVEHQQKPQPEEGFAMNDHPAANTDHELWREVEGDYYSPSIHVTAGGGIGINVGGLVIVKTLREWHRLTNVRHDGPRR